MAFQLRASRLYDHGSSPGEQLRLESWRTRFVGRIPELASLLHHLELAEQGRASIALLVGEPGIGKTRIAEELAAAAERRGASVFWGQCFEGEGAPPFWPWVQVLRAWIRALPPETIRAALRAGTADLGLLLPELRDLAPDLPEPTPLDPAQARFRLFDSLSVFFRRIATHPCVIVLEDLHWADAPSLLLLEFLAAHHTQVPILIVGTYRDVEVMPGHSLSATLGGLIRLPRVQRILLSRLSPHEARQFIESTPGIQAARSLVRTVVDRAEGNPLFMGEMLRFVRSEQLEAATDTALNSLVPPTLHDIIGRRLRRLSATCRAMLNVAAVIGREVDLVTLRAAFGAGSGELMDALDEAEMVGVIAPVAGSTPSIRYRFTHALVRDTLYDALRATQRARLHLQVGAAIEQLPPALRQAHLAELAFHFVQAAPLTPPEQALRHVYRAAEHAVSLLAYEDGARLYQLALRMLDESGADDPEVRSDLLLRLGTLQSQMTDDAAARQSFLAAAALAPLLAKSIGTERAAHILAQAALGYGGVARLEYRSLDGRGMDLVERALLAVGQEDSADRARLLARLGAAKVGLEARHAGASIQDAIAVARRVGDPQALVYALMSRYHCLTIAEGLDDVLPLYEEVQALAVQVGNPALTINSQRWLIKYLLEIGDRAAAERALAEYGRQMDEVQYPYAEWRMCVARLSLALLTGDVDATEALSEQAVRLGPTQPRSGTPWFVGGELYLLRVIQGRLDEAEELLNALRREYPRFQGVRCARAWVLAERGDLDAARRELDALAENDFAELRYVGSWNYNVPFLAQACATLGDHERAALLYDLLLPQSRANIVSGVTFASYGAAAHHLARLAVTLDRPDEATRHFEAAIALHERLQARPLLAETRYHYAAALLANRADGGTQRAHEQARLALAAAESIGLPHLRERAAGLLAPDRRDRSLGAGAHGVAAGGRLSDPNTLTGREIEILSLLVAGSSNAEIAERLYLSTGTVHWYTVRIYQKLGVRGRVEAAAVAVRRGLVPGPRS